jgi:hypothetical protein
VGDIYSGTLVIAISVAVPVLCSKVEKHRQAWQYTALSVWVLQYCLFCGFCGCIWWRDYRSASGRGQRISILLLWNIVLILFPLASHFYSFHLIAGLTARSEFTYESILWVSQLQFRYP